MKANNEKANSVKVNESANVQAAAASSEPQQKSIEQKRADILAECFKEISVTEIQKSTVERFSAFGKFTAMYRGNDKQENGKFGKSGGKTIYNFETPTTIYMGYTSSELCDVFGLEKRQYKKSDVEQVSDTLAALRYFRASLLEVEEMGFATGVKLEIVDKWISETEFADKERADFEKRFAANIPLFPHITEEVFKGLPGVTDDDLTTALKLGYRFSDTKESDKESNQESNQESK